MVDTDKMDISFDFPQFDNQETHISFQERKWLWIQKYIYNLDDLVKSAIKYHHKIRGNKYFDSILIPSTTVNHPTIIDHEHLYYKSNRPSITDNDIDLLRLHYQQLFQLMFKDLCIDVNYRLFLTILEGFVFYSSQIKQEYVSAIVHEMNRCLSSFETFIRTRTSKILHILSYQRYASISYFTCVHMSSQNNLGVLFQLLPKFLYPGTPRNSIHSILSMDQYTKCNFSPEELRYINYYLEIKSNRHPNLIHQTKTNQNPVPFMPILTINAKAATSLALFSNDCEVFPTLPIVYPYTEDMVYNQQYPLFWTSISHQNERSNNLFEAISITKDTPEYIFVEQSFWKTVSKTQCDIIAIERIENVHLWLKFCAHRLYMRRKNGPDSINEEWLFHGTQSNNHDKIISAGFNRSYCNQNVLYGRGVYFSRFAGYSCRYGDLTDISYIFLCRVLVGNHTFGNNSMNVAPSMILTNGKTVQADSTTDRKNPYTIVCTFHDDQNYPEYVITYLRKKNIK